MVRRLRLFLFVFALALTAMALSRGARAGECIEGQYGWIDFGSCCWPATIQLLRGHCVNGSWEIVPGAGYKCLADPC